MANKIVFHSKKKQNIGNIHIPESIKKNIPEWFLSADKHKKNKNGLYMLMLTKKNGDLTPEKVPSWKSCPAILDTALTGYVLKTPVDITIGKDNNSYKIINFDECKFFCNVRGEEEGFPTPVGYENLHFFWDTNWMPTVPNGYTTLWTHPLNRFDLPFLTISGFIDPEIYNASGKVPFFIKKDFEGTIPAGTPFVQIIPIKNEKWEIDIKNYNEEEIKKNYEMEKNNFFTDDTLLKTIYKKRFWVKKQYD